MRAIDRCRELALFTEEPGHITRTFLSAPMHQVHASVTTWMEAAGCDVGVDAAGNIRGRYPGKNPCALPLLIGSHLDTVPHAGAFDGILGVVLGIELVSTLGGERLECPIEVIGFSEEEGVRYGVPFIGSRLAVGDHDPDLVRLVIDALQDFGLNPARLHETRIPEAAGFLEFHIEQGPVLESLGLPLGIVEAIAGQSRLSVTFHGSANHAGTTPMHLRSDALAAAAEWILIVQREARTRPGLVATVGKLAVEPNATNIIPGAVTASLDVRHAMDSARAQSVENILSAARSLNATYELRLDQPAVAMDRNMTAGLDQAVQSVGLRGAPHDQRRWPRRYDHGPTLPIRHAVPAQPRRHQPSSRRIRAP